MKIRIRNCGIRKFVAVGIASFFVLLSACDSAKIGAPPADTNMPGTTTPGDTTDIIATATAAGNFSTLLGAIEQAGLTETLAAPDNINTVFAPTDMAFELLGEEAVAALLADPAALENTLLYHVTAGEQNETAIADLIDSNLQMLNGQNLPITLDEDYIIIGTAMIETPDIIASNGIIHVIDAVLIPPATDLVDIISTAEAAGTFNTLLQALEAADLRTTLADASNVNTVFAPTDAAFELLGEEAITALLADSVALSDTLLYHVLPGNNDAAAITALAGTTVTMLNEKEAAVVLDDEILSINTSIITATDIAASNGVIHVIDAVLSPPKDAPEEAPTQNLAELISSDPQFETLSTALTATGLDTELANAGEFTVFAPNDAAFEALGEESVNALLASEDALRTIILYHVVPTTLDSTAAIAAAGTDITSAAGTPLSVSLNGEALMINDATVVRADISGSNGVIHEIDSVLQAPAVTSPSNSVMDALIANPAYSSLVALIQSAGLTETLKNVESDFTVFAPNNAAIAAADIALQAGFTTDPVAMAQLLLGHVHSTSLEATAVAALAGTDLAMANGSAKAITVAGTAVMIGTATVVDADIAADNGVIHGIDTVLFD